MATLPVSVISAASTDTEAPVKLTSSDSMEVTAEAMFMTADFRLISTPAVMLTLVAPSMLTAPSGDRVMVASALLAQIKMLLRMAALANCDPQEPQRAAELLVIMDVYPDVPRAAAALKALPAAEAATRRRHSAVYSMVDVIRRMAKLLGLIAPAAVTPVSRLVHLGRWLLLGLALVVGMVVPLIWLPYLSMSYYRGTVDLAERISVFYSGPEKALHLPRKASDVPGLAAAAGRALASLALVVGGLAVFLALDVEIGGHQWPALVSLAVLISSATGLVWYLRRVRHRHQHRGEGS